MQTTFHDFLDRRLREPLPGANAHRKMLPLSSELVNTEARVKPEAAPPNANKAQFLSLLLIMIIASKLFCTLRSGNLTTHKGQISLPGGRKNNR